MKLQRFRWILVMGIAVAAISFTGCKKESAPGGRTNKGGGGDDEPIVVAGGSMHIAAKSGKFKQDGDNLVHADMNDVATQRYVGAVDILYFDNNNLPAYARKSFNNKVTITMNYCEGGDCDATTLETDQNGKGLTFSAHKHKPKDDDRPLPNVVSHQSPKGHIKDINVPGSAQPYGCGPDGRCWLVIHYCTKADCS